MWRWWKFRHRQPHGANLWGFVNNNIKTTLKQQVMAKSIWERAAEMERPENGGNRDTGYIFKTTFWHDFKVADVFGVEGVRDTFDRAFNEWKNDAIYLTELVLVLNWRCGFWYGQNNELCNLYGDLYEQADTFARDTLTGEAAEYYFKVTD